MNVLKITLLATALVECCFARGYGIGSGGAIGGRSGDGFGGLSGAGGYGSGVGGAGGYGSGVGGAGGYGRGAGGVSGYGSGVGGSVGVGGAGRLERPKPYNMGYQNQDEQGNADFRSEQGDANGNIQGIYGYTDNQGLYREVKYTAGPAGFQASVKTNEPGTDGKENPANVIMNVQQPPAGIQDQYTRPAGVGGGFGSGMGLGGGYGGSGLGLGGGAGLGGLGGLGGGYGGMSSGGFGGMIGGGGLPQGGQGVRSGKSGY